MRLVAEAVWDAFRPEKLNYELLGAGKGLHNEADQLDDSELAEMRSALNAELNKPYEKSGFDI